MTKVVLKIFRSIAEESCLEKFEYNNHRVSELRVHFLFPVLLRVENIVSGTCNVYAQVMG